ncbi:MAG: glycosyltransferase family 4 protein, partial [Pelolinea sp.]|nr:glycosyltransferase family 4 protein [Pelolinea sp.]
LKNRYDHVFNHFAGYGEGAALNLIRKWKEQHYSVVFHFPPSLVPHRYVEFRNWHINRDADYLIGVSEGTAREVSNWSGRQVDVIGHGANASYFSPDPELRKKTRRQLGIPDDALVLITVAALEERKGDQWVIRAMQAHSSAYYLVVGDGPFASELKQLATSLHLEKRVLFLGFQLDVKSFLAASDIAFLLSYGEASSISLLEYAAMELPIVTSRHEPFPELLQDAWGHMVDEQNTSAVSDLITDLSDSERRGRMGKSAREWVIREHNWDDIAGKYRALIQ